MKTKFVYTLFLSIFLYKVSFAQFLPIEETLCDNPLNCSDWAFSENAVCIDPYNSNNIMVACNVNINPIANSGNQFLGPNGTYSVAVGRSNDGGMTWKFSLAQSSYADPSVAVDNSGNGYLFCIGGISGNNGVICYKYPNLFTSTSIPVPIDFSFPAPPNTNSSPDKTNIWIDNSTALSKIYYGYTGFTQLLPMVPKVYIRSSDANNFNTVTNEIDVTLNIVSPAQFENHSINIKTGPSGMVYSCWVMYDYPFSQNVITDETGIGFSSYNPGSGVLMNGRIIIPGNNEIRGTRNTGILPYIAIGGANIASLPSMAVYKPTGSLNDHIYIVWTNIGIPGINQGDPDVYFIKSIDGGQNWTTTPLRINNDMLGNNNYYPAIACDPATGVLAVVYYDSRDDISGDYKEEPYVALSENEGDTWVEFPVSFNKFHSGATQGADYIGIDIKNNFVVPVYTTQDGYYKMFTDMFNVSCDADLTPLGSDNYDPYCGKYLGDGFSSAIPELQVLRASNTVEVAGYSTSCFYCVRNSISGHGKLITHAGTGVHFGSGFHVENGADFHSYIKNTCYLFDDLRMAAGSNMQQTTSMLHSLNNSGIHIKEQVILSGNKLNLDDKISIYPNPASKSFYLKINSTISDSIYVEIINVVGQLISSFHRNTFAGIDQINVNEATGLQFKPGIYIVRIKKSNCLTQLRIVIND